MGLNLLLADIQAGGYVSGLKVIPVVLILLIWTRLLTWIDKDTITARLPRIPINMGMIGGLIGAFILFFILPTFLIGLVVLLGVLIVEMGVYLLLRKQSVGLGDLGDEFKNWLRSLRGKEKEVKEIVGAVQLVGQSGSLLPAPDADTPEAESYNGMQRMLTDPLENNADIIEIMPAEGGLMVKYSVDGVVYTGASVPKQLGAAAVSYLKAAAGLDMNEVRKPQTGTLKLNINKRRRELALTTKGSTAGEFARMISEPKKRHSFALETLGMQQDQVDLIRNEIKEGGGGVVLLSAPKGTGLTSLSYAMLRAHDAFLEHIMTLERDQEQDLEGITQNKLASNATAVEESKQASWLTSQQPDVLLVSKPESPQTAQDLVKAAKDGRRVYVSLVAGNVSETISAWKKVCGGDEKLAVSALKMVISGRTLRKLCEACKQGYAPDPETLRKLNMDPHKVTQLFQARKEPIRDPKGNPIRCEFCNDLRYKGRSGIYEIMTIDDEIKQILLAGGTPAQLKTAFRKQRGRYLQEMGLLLVEQGETSVQEVLRVLKADSGGSGGSRSQAQAVSA
jgi:general secretion pathway protein E